MFYSEKLQYFVETIREGSLLGAAKKLGVAISTVSKTLTALENELGKKLVKRSKRGVELTEVGRGLFESIIESYITIEQKYLSLQKQDHILKDVIKIITTTGASSLWILPKLKNFMEKYPHVRLKIETVNKDISLTETDADVAILPRVNDLSKVAKWKLTTIHNRLYASQGYLDTHGTPQGPEDLKNHKLISYYHENFNYWGNVDWHLTCLGQALSPSLVINSAISQYYAALLGYGIVAIPQEFPFVQDTLIQILPQIQGVDIDIFFIMRKNNVKDQLLKDLYESFTGGKFENERRNVS